MVSIERQRTHMSFDGLSDVLGALGPEPIACEVEGRQRPDGGNAISTKVGSGLYSHLLALGEESSDDVGFRSAEALVAEVCFSHIGLHGDSTLVPKGDGLQRPAINSNAQQVFAT